MLPILDTVSRKLTSLFRKRSLKVSSESVQGLDLLPDQAVNDGIRRASGHGRPSKVASGQHPRTSGPRKKNKPAKPPSSRTSGYFGTLALTDLVCKALSAMGYTEPTPIQAAVIPEVLGGNDVVGQAQTGTGKTAAFGIPIVEALSRDSRMAQALVLVPTRELAVQVRDEIGRLARFRGLRAIAVYGGQSINVQLDAMRKGVHIIVATPGRLIDHLERGTVLLNKLRFLVLDEADQMLDIGFADDIRRIFRYVPTSRRTMLFSATMPSSIKNLVYRYMRDPVWITLGGDAEPVDEVKQVYFEVAERDRYSALDELLKVPNEIKQALVFRRTKTGVDRLVNFLKNRSHNVQAIHGDVPQSQRDAVMARFRTKKLRVLVATNVAARGLDIPAVSHVINYDMPGNLEEYIHRIGRTARMGKPGTAITFVSEWDFDMLDLVRSHVGEELKIDDLSSYLNPSRST